MTRIEDPETEVRLRQAGEGREEAVRWLLDRHRGRLRRMISEHLDVRLAARLDPSDIVQETLIDAAKKLEGYLRDRPLPFYPWLHRIAKERIAEAHRSNLRTRRRQVNRELIGGLAWTEATGRQLVDMLASSGTGPCGRLIREEDREAVWRALDKLSPLDRDVLVLRYVEQLGFTEIAGVLGISPAAARLRHFRALQRIGSHLGTMKPEPET